MSYDQSALFGEIITRLKANPGTSLGALSHAINVSRRTIEGNVCKMSGRQFKDLRQEYLVMRIQEILKGKPAISIKELSFAVGFRSSRSFARAVNRAFRCTPTELRSRQVVGCSGYFQ